MNDLHAQIMNLPCKAPSTLVQEVTREHYILPQDPVIRAYRVGHRDARHAAAELALAHDARVRQLEADAARYRLLRDASNAAPDNTPTIYSSRKNGLILYGSNLDDAIDALKDRS